jgi:hypothetical protein
MVHEMLSEKGKRALIRIFEDAKYRIIGQPTTDPTARPFPNITPVLINAVKTTTRNNIKTVLMNEGYTITAALDKSIIDFVNANVDRLIGEAKGMRIGALTGIDDKKAEAAKKAYQIGDTAAPPAGYTGPYAPQWLRKGYKPFKLLSEKTGHRVQTVFFSLILLVIGITITAIVGSIWYLIGFMFWAFYTILPDPEEIKMTETPGTWFGSFLSGDDKEMARENRTNTGVAFMKAVSKVGVIVCFIGGLYSQQFPLSNLLLLFLAFGSYFSMKIEFETRKPYEFIESFFRVLLGLFIAIFIFGAFGAGIFQSRELGWLTLAFFVVLPVATEKHSVARALGLMGKGSGESSEMIDKIIFVFIMLMFMGGSALTGGFAFVGGFFSGTGGIVFSAVWVLGLVAGLTTPAETRPWMGIIILIVGFIVFGLGAGQQTMGVAFFGEWWPTIHNTVTEFMKPIGDMFAQFQMTFGQSWLLFTNPVAYAQQITQGSYAQNELGIEGAYGLEIRKFQVQSIYIDEPFMIEIELENRGIFDAKNIRVDILTNIRDFKIGKDATSIVNMTQLPEKDKYDKTWYKYTVDMTNILGVGNNKIERQNIVPIFLIGKMSCADFESSAWRDFGVLGGKEHTVREMFIPFTINITYEYEATSNLQMDFISSDEWKRLSLENKLERGTKQSLISTAPASLNLGSMDQPIKEDSPFYVGFNLTSTWFKNTLIAGGNVTFYVPTDFEPFSTTQLCTKTYSGGGQGTGTYQNHYVYTFDLTGYESKAAFCSYKKLKTSLSAPKKTYMVFANASYTFSKWDSKDTQVNFKDVCWPREQTSP